MKIIELEGKGYYILRCINRKENLRYFEMNK